MSEDHEVDIIDQLNRLAPLIKMLIAGASGIAMGLLGVAFWVWTIDGMTRHHEVRLDDAENELHSVESWRITIDAAPKVAPGEVNSIDKRLQRVEDQNAVIVQTLQRIEAKL